MKTRYIPLATALSLAMSASAYAQNDRCTALRFYGSATNSGLCKSLSPANQNLQVCDLSGTQPDIHLTFGLVPAGVPPVPVPLHLTVRSIQNGALVCQGNVNIMYNAANNRFQAANLNPICGVSVASYVDRMNAQPLVPATGGQSACRSAFQAAQSKLDPAVFNGYMAACNVAAGAAPAAPAACN